MNISSYNQKTFILGNALNMLKEKISYHINLISLHTYVVIQLSQHIYIYTVIYAFLIFFMLTHFLHNYLQWNALIYDFKTSLNIAIKRRDSSVHTSCSNTA